MTQFVTVPPFGADQRQIAEVLRGAMDGKTNNTGTITLATGSATTTVIYNERLGFDSVVLLSPTTLNSAAYATTLFVSANAQGSATLTHPANTVSGRTFDYVIVG